MFIETDRGFESTSILYNKLVDYDRHGLMISPERRAIVFSFSKYNVGKNKTMNLKQDYIFSRKKLTELLDFMDANYIDNAYDVLKKEEYQNKIFLEKLLITTGAARFRQNELKRGKFIADKSFIKEFLELTNIQSNPYQHKEFNKMHAKYAWNKLVSIGSNILDNNLDLPLFAYNFLHGSSAIFAPTPLVAERYAYNALSIFKEERENLLISLKSYFKDIRFNNEVGKKLELSYIKNHLNLRNEFCFTGSDGEKKSVYVEFPSQDLGAWIRVNFFAKYYKGKKPIQLICVMDTYEQAKEFFKRINYLYPVRNMQIINIHESGIEILLRSNIGLCKKKLFRFVSKSYDKTLDFLNTSE